MMSPSEILEHFEDNEEALFLPEEYHPALIGVGYRFSDGPLAVYDLKKVLEILQSEGMDEEESLEWYQYNIVGAWVGSGTPIFVEL